MATMQFYVIGTRLSSETIRILGIEWPTEQFRTHE